MTKQLTPRVVCTRENHRLMKNIKVVEIEVNSNCNMACSYCPNEKYIRKENGKMSYELYDRILAELVKIDFSGKISFNFYNEPLLINDLEYYVARAKSKLPKIFIHLYTNGTKLNQVRFDALLEAGVDLFVVTKHENINHLVFEDTLKTLEESIRKKHVIFKSHQDIKLTNRGGLLDMGGVDIAQDLPCTLTSHMITFTVLGNVIPCFEDFNQVHQMGNIQEESLQDIWQKPEYISMRKMLLFGKRKNYDVCSKCNRLEAIYA
jgi:radical SAM protein with 4Fe4S-binding SPASM domain